MSRPKITKITINIDGRDKPLVVEGDKLPEALFFSDRSVKWIGAIYDIYQSLNAVKTLTSEEVNDLWNSGPLPSMLAKMPSCALEKWPPDG